MLPAVLPATGDRQKAEAGSIHADQGLVLQSDHQLHPKLRAFDEVQQLSACRGGCLRCKLLCVKMRQPYAVVSIYKAEMGIACVGRGLICSQGSMKHAALHCPVQGGALQGDCMPCTRPLQTCGNWQQPRTHLPVYMQAAVLSEGLQQIGLKQMACGGMGPCCATLGGCQ